MINVVFNDALNTFYLRLYCVKHNMVKNHSYSERMDLLYTLSHRQDMIYYDLCYTSSGAVAGTRNSAMGPP